MCKHSHTPVLKEDKHFIWKIVHKCSWYKLTFQQVLFISNGREKKNYLLPTFQILHFTSHKVEYLKINPNYFKRFWWNVEIVRPLVDKCSFLLHVVWYSSLEYTFSHFTKLLSKYVGFIWRYSTFYDAIYNSFSCFNTYLRYSEENVKWI